MDSNRPNPPPGAPQPPPGMSVVHFDLLALRYRTLLGYLFTHPKLALALLCIRPFVCKSLLTLLALCIAGGFAMARFRSRWSKEDIRDSIEFLHDSVGDTTVSDQRFVWQTPTPSPLPASQEIGAFRLTVTEAADVQAAQHAVVDEAPSASRMGLVIAPAHVWCWARGEAEGVLTRAVWQELPLMRHLQRLDVDDTQRFHLTEETIPAYVDFFALTMFIGQWIMESAALVGQWVLWCLLMMVISIVAGLMGGRMRQAGIVMMPFGRRLLLALSLSANLTLVPLLAALIYAATGMGTPSSLVGVMFLIYMVYAAIEGRHSRVGFIPPRPGDRRPPSP